MLIRNIWAIGRNYADHAKELGHQVPGSPLIFLKAGSCAVIDGAEIVLPSWATDVHHEVELAVQLDENRRVHRAAVALDLTERTLQNVFKAKGWPWTLAKSFTGSCPVSEFFAVKDLEELKDLEITLAVNGQVRQHGRTSQMIFSLAQQLEFLYAHFPVCPGDLLLTGTPAGVGPLKKGDDVLAEISGKTRKRWTVG